MIEKFTVTITPFGDDRRIHVHLPEGYYDTDERYPVMYMFDGHNLYEDEEATYGKSWGLEEFLNAYDKPMIMVGMECSHEGNGRLEEYCPYDILFWDQQLQGKGDIYMDWVVHELKPYIDKNYRTMPFRECTAVGGSSMGGLMAYYTVYKYNRWFSKAACLSPSIIMCREELFADFADSYISPDTRIYFSFGTNEIGDPRPHLVPFVEDIERRQGYHYVDVIPEGHHNEATWETRNPIYMDFLWK